MVSIPCTDKTFSWIFQAFSRFSVFSVQGNAIQTKTDGGVLNPLSNSNYAHQKKAVNGNDRNIRHGKSSKPLYTFYVNYGLTLEQKCVIPLRND